MAFDFRYKKLFCMELIRGIHNIKADHYGCVLSVGNFDGVHLGHEQVLSHLVAQAKKLGVPSMVMLFEPQPQEYFAIDTPPARLSLLRDKLVRMQALGVDRVLCIYFNARFSSYQVKDFIEGLLVEKLGVRFLVVGDDFRFGQNRQGNFEALQQAGLRHDFQVHRTESLLCASQRVSSSLIRERLSVGDLDQVRAYLGRDYRLTGRVQHGAKVGRTLGFPTANIALKRKQAPVRGVFAAKLRCREGEWLEGVANVGFRPTVHGRICLLEVHVFDFEQDIYGCAVEVALVSKLREEKPFSSMDELKKQIALDAQQAKLFFKSSAK
jgi:riboflavin kinase/FMN adenylyltransferase